MAHTVRPDSASHDDRREIIRTDDVCIDLRHGDLSDEAVVSILLDLARERAAQADDTNVLGAAASGPSHVTTYGSHDPRRRWWPAVAVVGVVLVVAALVVIGARPRPGNVTAADLPGTSDASTSSSPASTPQVRATPTTSGASTSPASSRPATAAGGGTEAGRAADFCAAVRIYTLDNLITLAENGVRDPRGTISAYATMVATAPPEIAEHVTALGPVTGKVQAEIETGRITTPEQMQQFLAGGAPADEVGRWIVAQHAIAAELPRLCPAASTP